MSTIPIFNSIRIIPRDTEFLDRKRGSRGEIYYDKDNNTFRLFDGQLIGGFELSKNDLSNVTNDAFLAKATAAGVGGGGGNTTVTVSDEVPATPDSGNLWLNTNNGILYVYIDDGDSEQWIQPSVPAPDLSGYATTASLSAVATSGSYNDLSDKPTIPTIPTDISDLTDDTNLLFSGDYVDLTNKPTIPVALTDLGISDGTVGQVLTTDGDGNFTFEDAATGGGDIGSFVFTGTNIDTDDSSGISVTPAVTFESDIIVENEINAATIFVTNVNVAGSFTSTGSGTPEIVSDNEIFLTPGTTTVLNGLTTFNQTTEVVNTKTGATGTIEHDFSTGSLFLHSNIAANFTANFTNVPTTNNRSTTVALILDQGATAYIPNALQIDGAAQTIKWSGGSVPSGTNNYIDIVNFTLIRANNAWTVIGSLSTYN